MMMQVNISIGELLDKISILMIKSEKIKSDLKRKNVEKELNSLIVIANNFNFKLDSPNFKELKKINTKLWEIEDNIRIKEAKKQFDSEFIELARSVYKYNDKRFVIKNAINVELNSEFFEEKEYEEY